MPHQRRARVSDSRAQTHPVQLGTSNAPKRVSRRDLFRAAGAAGVGAVVLPGRAEAAQRTNPMQDCIDRCQTCQEVCLNTVTYCLGQGGKHVEVRHLGLLIACADMCDTSARFMLLGQPLHPRTCGVCAEVCDACAKSCDAIAGDKTMQACAEECRRCAESCGAMAKSAA